MFLLALSVYDVFLVLIAPPLTRCGDSIMEIVALGLFDSAHHVKTPFLLKIPVWYPTSGSDKPFTILRLQDTVIPGLLVACSPRFDIQAHSLWIYFVTSTAAYSCGLLASFAVSALTQISQLFSTWCRSFLLLAWLLLFCARS